MTRKDYVLIAEALNSARLDMKEMPHGDRTYGTYQAAESIAYALRRTNPRFEKARFMEACGFPHWK